MFTADQIVAHLVGDFISQSHWMAQEKTKKFKIAFIHAAIYSLPFLFITRSFPAMTIIILSHALIDHFRLAKYINWFRNQLAPKKFRYKFNESDPFASKKDTPEWLSGWLLYINDNIIHIVVNGLAIYHL